MYVDLRAEGIRTTVNILMEKLREVHPSDTANVPSVWVAGYSANTLELIQNEELPDSAPRDYAYLCDWLQADLLTRLSRLGAKNARPVGDYRDGEFFGIRIAFEWNPQDSPLPLSDTRWFELVEMDTYENIFPDG